MQICIRERVVSRFHYIYNKNKIMASYTAAQLYGKGSYSEALNGNKTFTITNPYDGTSYFTIEAVRNSDGFFDSTSNKVAEGAYTIGNNIKTLVTSSYVASVTVPPGTNSMSINFDNNTPISGSILRATGGITLTIS